LPPEKRHGTIFTKQEDLWEYIKFFWLAFFGFGAYCVFLTVFFNQIWKKGDYYFDKGAVEKRQFIQVLVSNTHHVLMAVASIYTLMTPDCKDPYPLQWIYDPVCHHTVDIRQVRNVVVFFGYLAQDLVQMTMWVRDSSKTAKEMMLHHIIGLAATFFVVLSGYMSPGMANIMLLMEISTVPLNYRWLYPKEKYGTFMP
jgi:hypothetical protein